MNPKLKLITDSPQLIAKRSPLERSGALRRGVFPRSSTISRVRPPEVSMVARPLRRSLMVLANLFALVLMVSCGPKEVPKAVAPPPSVTVAKPIVKKITERTEYTGRLDSNENVEIRARVSGYLDQVHFTEGQEVKAGDLLFTIDQRPFKAELNRADAAVALAKAAADLASTNLQRSEKLITSNAISKEEFDIRKSEAQQAQATLAVAAANLETAGLNLSFTEIRAPISGIAGRHLINKGNLIDGGSTNSSLLTTVVPYSPIFVYFEMDETSRLADVRREFKGELPGRENEGLPVEIQLSDEKGFPHTGVIDFIDNRLNKNTATITVRGRFENKDKFLTPGLFARVRVPSSKEHDAVLIPDSAIGTTQSFKYVWVVGADNQVKQQQVEPGPIYDGLRIIRTGVSDADRIVTKGIQLVRPGAPVTVASEETISLPDETTKEKAVAQNSGKKPEGS